MKRTAYVVLSAIVAVVALGMALLMLLIDDENISERFENFTALERSESWQKGWVPMFIPKAATSIYVQHNMDTNQVYGEFSAQSFLLERDIAGLRKLTDVERDRLIDAMPWGDLKRGGGKKALYSWCDQAERMNVNLYVGEAGRVIYWGGSGKSCSQI